MQDVELRERVHTGLNKGAPRNAFAKVVSSTPLAKIRGRTFKQQRYRSLSNRVLGAPSTSDLSCVEALLFWKCKHECVVESSSAH